MGRKLGPTTSAFGNLIREKRERLNLSRGDIADQLGYSRSFLDVLETGRRGCDLDDLPRLAHVLQTDRHELARVYLAERHPAFYEMLYGVENIDVDRDRAPIQVEDSHLRLERLPRRERGIIEALIYSFDEMSRQLQDFKNQRGPGR